MKIHKLFLIGLIFIWPKFGHIFAKEIIIGVEEHSIPPLFLISKDGKVSGSIIEKLNIFLTSKNLKYVYKAQPITRLHSSLRNGSIDLKFPDNEKWGAPIKDSDILIYTNTLATIKDITVSYKEIEKIKTVGILRGFTPVGLSNYKLLKYHNFNSATNLLNALRTKRIDAIYINENIYNNSTTEREKLSFKIHEDMSEKSDFKISSRKENKQLIEEINTFFKKKGQFSWP